MRDWKALAGRVTLFPGVPGSAPLPSAFELYKQVWDADPDNFQTNPNALMPNVAQGKRSGIGLGCSVHPARIDFNFMPPAPSHVVPGMSLLLIEDTRQLRKELALLIDFIGGHDISHSISRIGLFLHFVAVAQSVEQANKILSEVTPDRYRTEITKEEDFIFQINLPRLSQEIETVKINYLTKWSSDRFQVLSIPINTSVSAAMTPVEPREFNVASVTFDHNNVPVNEPFTREQQSSLLIECMGAAVDMQKTIGLNIEGF